MREKQLLMKICQKEIECGCYDAVIDGVSIYSFVRYDVRNSIIAKSGFNVMPDRNMTSKRKLFFSLFMSICHLSKLYSSRNRYLYVFYPFARTDKVGEFYLDKFTDPIIDVCKIQDYIILDRGRAGVHPRPRVHSDKVVYVDFLQVYASIKAQLFYKHFVKQFKTEFDKLSKSLLGLTGERPENWVYKKIVYEYYYSKMYKHLLSRVKAKCVIGPTRSQQTPIFVAARHLGLLTLELQHGVTYSETPLYSGYRDPMIVPDFFLAFGENKPADVYGIDDGRIVNIGYALFDYLKKLPKKIKKGENGVLVISDPQITDVMVEITLNLSKDNPDLHFYFRPHPHEKLSIEQKEKIEKQSNCFIQDRTINIIEVLNEFDMVIGESSTVLYEALSMGKKVGRLHYDGLNPQYLLEEDKKDFWQISNQNDFEAFIKDKPKVHVRSIYSKFDKKKFIALFEGNYDF